MHRAGIPDDIDPSIRLIIVQKIHRIIYLNQVCRQDRADLEQHLLTRVLERQHRFDPSRGASEVFATVVVGSAIVNYLRDRAAGKRSPRGTMAASDALSIVSDDRSGRDLHLVDLAFDVAEVIARLPADLRELAEALKRGTLSDAARALRRPRVSLYPRLAALRREFERANYGNYH